MSTLTLPFKGSLSTNGTVFEIDCPGEGGTAITGSADSGSGVSGASTTGSGVYGASKKFDAIVGESSSDANAGVTGRNLTTGANGGVGLYGTGGLLAGKFDGNVVVNGNANADAFNATSASAQHAGVSANNTAGGFGLWTSSNGVGIYGRGTTYAGQFDGNVVVSGNASADAFIATSASPQHAGVSANNTAGGFGLWCSSNGMGIYGRGATLAAQFDGNVVVNGNASADAFNATSSSPQHAGVSANNNAGGFGLWASSNAVAIFGRGTPAGYFDGDIQVTGDLVLLNSPSSGDIAEDFDLEDDPLHEEPGTVLIIAPSGKLSASVESYDTRVAGVVSGAGELRPAVILQRLQTQRRRSPIALIGKVFCKVDAAFGSVTAGDLLTTSSTQGHAMKVTDRTKALGAILGKALGPLDNGRGLIPILVSLR